MTLQVDLVPVPAPVGHQEEVALLMGQLAPVPSCKWPGCGSTGPAQLCLLHGEALARMEEACRGLSLLHVDVPVISL